MRSFHTFSPRVYAAFVLPRCVDTLNEPVAEQALTSSLPGKLSRYLQRFSLPIKASFSFYLLKLTSKRLNCVRERFVQTLKRSLRASEGDGSSLSHRLAEFLLSYQITPHALFGLSLIF